MTYLEQLQHPKWQRRRLEMLDGAGYECTQCGDTETQLHVHHRRYVKGRMAWEYENWELAVLCKNCHDREHASRDNLTALLAQCDEGDVLQVCGYVAGMIMWRDPEIEIGIRSHAAAVGMADAIGGVTADQVIDSLGEGGHFNSARLSALKDRTRN